jgi:hypothetical protein
MTARFARLALAAATATLCFAAASEPAFAESPFVGVWDARADTHLLAPPPGVTPIDRFEAVFRVSEIGGVYDIEYLDTYPAPSADRPPAPKFVLSDIVVNGDSFSFSRTAQAPNAPGVPQGPFVIHYEGTIAGDAFTGTVSSPNAPELGPFPYTGQRR